MELSLMDGKDISPGEVGGACSGRGNRVSLGNYSRQRVMLFEYVLFSSKAQLTLTATSIPRPRTTWPYWAFTISSHQPLCIHNCCINFLRHRMDSLKTRYLFAYNSSGHESEIKVFAGSPPSETWRGILPFLSLALQLLAIFGACWRADVSPQSFLFT